MDMPTSIPVDFTIGSRRLFAVTRELATWSFTLAEALRDGPLPEPPQSGPAGLRVLSVPARQIATIIDRCPRHLIGARQDYNRHYIDMRAETGAADYDAYLAQFSGKTRSTLRRKARKLAKEVGESYRISEHHSPAEIEQFLDCALPLSAKTYQARLLDAGLPESPKARNAMLEAAERDEMRGFLLHSDDEPIAYLSLPVAGRTLIYAHLGYDPEWARLSPGTVLQMEALERLFAEQRYDFFDFTEGDGAHKAMFGTHSVECSSFLLLEPTLTNRALLSARSGFDGLIATSKHVAKRSGALSRVRGLLKT